MTGFDSRNKTNLDKKYICPACSLILRDPVQLTECGHRVCQSCFRQESKDLFKCPQCHIETSKDDALFDRGFRNEMESLSIDCFSCQWSGFLKDYQKHLDDSHFHPKCEFCNQEFDLVEQLNEHKEKQCEKFIVHCILKDHGCNELIVRSQMKEHYLTQKHQDILLKCIRQMKSLLAGAGIDTSFSQRTTTTTINDSVTAELLEFYETLDILTGGIETLMDDSQRLTIEASQQQVKIQAIEEQLSKVKLSLQESQGFFEGMKHNQDIMNQETLSLKETVDDMKYVSYDGTLIWKITNFREKLSDAQSERQTSIYSPPFYSSPTGYKMRARLYLQGDGNARNSHMSLFFVLMRGPNDAILKFPFTYKVTFCLYDQNGTGRHIIDSFRPDTRSNSFQRPRSEMNIASGIPKFFPLSLIEQEGSPYVRDDTMFIKVFVDFADMARNLVPFAMNLNPGLPTAIQHGFIKQEAERRMEQEQQPNTAT